jgi:hypothetical protein
MYLKDIRWCKKVSGKFKAMSAQGQPLTNVISRSKDGCVLTQESKIFYHIEHSDVDLEIMCESGYNENMEECGMGGAYASLHIKTDVATGGEECGIQGANATLYINTDRATSGEKCGTEGANATLHVKTNKTTGGKKSFT